MFGHRLIDRLRNTFAHQAPPQPPTPKAPRVVDLYVDPATEVNEPLVTSWGPNGTFACTHASKKAK